MLITDNTGMGLYFEEVDRRWWLADCLSNGLKDISLDVVAMEIQVWEFLFDLVQWCKAVSGNYTLSLKFSQFSWENYGLPLSFL